MEKNKFIGYDYTDITINEQVAGIYLDNYLHFGWQLDSHSATLRPNTVTLTFKRDRKIDHQADLNRLQRKFDGIVAEIISLKHAKRLIPATVAYLFGVIGTALMAGAVFAILGHQIPLMVSLAIPGTLGWIMPYFLYRSLTIKRTKQLSPIVDEKFEDIYAVTKDAKLLLV